MVVYVCDPHYVRGICRRIVARGWPQTKTSVLSEKYIKEKKVWG
jgi:hypothetical protein